MANVSTAITAIPCIEAIAGYCGLNLRNLTNYICT